MSTPTPVKSAAVPHSRLSRLTRLGSLAGRIAGNVLVEGGRQLATGQKPAMSALLLTPGNVQQLADKLASMRGAAMKVGQLLSMDAGTLLPKELADILARLRDDAMIMPAAQLFDVLERNWGDDWQQPFKRFSYAPVAAASIGQVHRAETTDGRHLAVKIQYPGVRQSIDSDLDNIAALLRFSGLLPTSLDIQPLLEEARNQLKQEADYRREGEQIEHYRRQLEGFHRRQQLIVPAYYPDLSSDDILCMSYEEGIDLQQLSARHPQQADQLMSLLMALFFAELFEFGCVQTDPNLGNYRYQADSERLVLLDFGAVRHFSPAFVDDYGAAIKAAARSDLGALDEALLRLGFFADGAGRANKDLVLEIFALAAEPLRCAGAYDFGQSDLASRIQARGMAISRERDNWHTPPPAVIFLHRKMGGLYLMAAQLKARVDVGALFERYL